MANWTGSYRSTGGTFDSGYIHAEVYVERTDSNTSSSIKVYSRCYAVSGVSSSWIKGKASYNQSGQYVSGDEGVNVAVSAGTTTFTSRTFSVTRGTTAKTATCKSYVYGYGGGGMYDGDHDEASMTVTIPALTSYTVSYNANGGSGAPANQTKYYGVNLTLSTTIPTKSGYSFKGWATSADSTSVAYSPGATYTGDAALTLYAIWSLDYIDPVVGSVIVTRCDSSGQEQENGTSAKVVITWSTDSNYAGSKCEISYKESSETTYGTTITKNNLSGSSGTIEERIDGNFDIKKSYTIKVVLTDTHDGTAVNYGGVPVCFSFLQFLAGGTGIAIGKYASVPNKIETTFPVIIQSSNITDGVTPSTDISTKSLLFLDNNNNEIGWCDSRFEIDDQPQFTRMFTKRAITANNTTNEYFNGIYMGLKNDGSPIVAFNNYTNKHAWQHALEPDVLYEQSSHYEGMENIQLSASAADYNHMRIYYRYFDTLMPESSVEIFEPNGKYVHMFIGYAGYGSGYYWPCGRDMLIDGNQLKQRYSFLTTNATSTVRTTGTKTYTQDGVSYYYRLSVVRVEAWNDSWWG